MDGAKAQGDTTNGDDETHQELAECHGLPLENLDRDIWDLFARTADQYPDHEAVVSLWQAELGQGVLASHETNMPHPSSDAEDATEETGPVRWTYRDLLHRSESLARWLQERGCSTGMRLVAVLWNSAEWALCFWTAARLGMVFVPLDPRLLGADAAHFINATDPTVIVVQDSDAEETLQKSAPASLASIPVKISCSTSPGDGWTPLPHPSQQWSPAHNGRNVLSTIAQAADSLANRIALIVFTSGTTSKPKGCVHTARNLWAQTYNYDPDPGYFERWLVHTPVSHIFAVNNCLRAWQNGDTVVFASKTFDVKATLRALVDEKCTFMSAIPALVQAIIAQPDFPGKAALSLRYVTLGSTMINEADIKLCKEKLGSCYAIQAFGMSEGAPVVSWIRPDPLLVDGYHPGVGKVLPGANIRICAPGDRKPLPRDQLGELHIGGPAVVSHYLDGVDASSFYIDHIGNWLVTGDQALIDQNGVLHIMGRYKDIIIRAGENIAPIKIEAALAEIPGVANHSQAQVVGIPDEIAGQVPVAIVKLPDGCSKTDVSKKAREMGPIYALDRVYTLSELDLKEFPLTITGKVRKEALKTRVLEHRDQIDSQKPPDHAHLPTPLDFTGDLLDVWEDLVGVRPALEDPIYTFADSITLLRYCDRVLSTLGQRIYLQDFTESPTVEDLAALVNSRAAPVDFHSLGRRTVHSSSHILNHQTCGTAGASTGTELTDFRKLPETIAAVAHALQDVGLGRDYATELLPIKDYFRYIVVRQRPMSYVHRICLGISEQVRPSAVRLAVETALSSRPILRTVLADLSDGTLFHVVCKPERRFFERMIHHCEVETTHEAELLMSDSGAMHSPRLMVQVQIITVRSDGSLHLTLTYNHTVFDMLSIIPFHSDLDRLVLLPDPCTAAMPKSTPFKLFADLYHSYQDSLPAEDCVEFNVHRLRGISKFTSALWPPQRAPGWMIGSDAGSLYASERAAVRNKIWGDAGVSWDKNTADAWSFPRLTRIINLHDVAKIRDKFKIDPQTIAKAGLAVFNVRQTGQPFAIFNTIEAGRSWPFVPDWMQDVLPHPMTIDGPTVEWMLNMINVELHSKGDKTEETVRGFVERMQHDQQRLESHVHAPWFKVLTALGHEEAAVAVDASYRQTFVWDATVRLMGQGVNGGDFKSLKIEGRHDWADCGVYWNCCMFDSTNLMIVASWDTSQMNAAEVDGHLDELTDSIRRLASLENWDRAITDVFAEAASALQ
ncbi:acetyl-CoA synthetase-like protein [Thozetella sp. PMI_491]|nr:acetyl-CoA synthetase-like protein [Thozetella sp. PMI_491]